MENDASRLLCGTPGLPAGRVALTFDDGPGPRTAELARMLRDEGVPGTFFVLGESVERHGDVLDTDRDCGHVIGLHADQHRPFRSAGHAADEMGRCAERVSCYLRARPGSARRTAWVTGRSLVLPARSDGTRTAATGTSPTGTGRRSRPAPMRSRIRSSTATAASCCCTTSSRPPSSSRPALTEADLDLRIVEITRLLIGRLRRAGLSFTGCQIPPGARQRRRLPVAAMAGRPAAGCSPPRIFSPSGSIARRPRRPAASLTCSCRSGSATARPCSACIRWSA